MSAAEQFHVSEVSPSYWRVTFDNGPPPTTATAISPRPPSSPAL
jgi:hypothetical protein